MRYTLEKKLLSFADLFFIKDESGRVLYEAAGKVLSIGAKISLKRPGDERERAYIEQKLALTYTYEIFTEGQLAGVLKQPMFSLGRRYTLQLPAGPVIEARGNVWTEGAELTLGGVTPTMNTD